MAVLCVTRDVKETALKRKLSNAVYVQRCGTTPTLTTTAVAGTVRDFIGKITEIH